MSSFIIAGNKDYREVSVPSWKNHVDIYLDEKETEFLATIYLDKGLGTKKNIQRRMGRNFTRLFIECSNHEQQTS